MPIEIHEVEITTAPTAAHAAPSSVPPASVPVQMVQQRLSAARSLNRELAARASRLRTD